MKLIYHNTFGEEAASIIKDGFIKPFISNWANETDCKVSLTVDETEYLNIVRFVFKFQDLVEKYNIKEYFSGFEEGEYRSIVPIALDESLVAIETLHCFSEEEGIKKVLEHPKSKLLENFND